MDVSSIALGGLGVAEGAVQNTATRLTAAGDPAARVGIAGEMVNLMQARGDYAANLKVLETGQEMQKSLIDIFA
jgi:flagellar hook-associated protein FlgK